MSSDPSPSPARGDVWLSAVFLAGFITLVVVAFGYPAASREVPVLVGVFGGGLSAIQLARSVRAVRAARTGQFASISRGHAVMFGWLVAAAGVVAACGILAGGALFIVLFLRIHLNERWRSACVAGLALSSLLHLTLERGLGVYLYQGLVW